MTAEVGSGVWGGKGDRYRWRLARFCESGTPSAKDPTKDCGWQRQGQQRASERDGRADQ
ncbi:MAG: hypothetical protein H6726_19130 [Sandaracinaceae bacterium]|nr:hypothetical protein [Sandaracinaceae bacterium]